MKRTILAISFVAASCSTPDASQSNLASIDNKTPDAAEHWIVMEGHHADELYQAMNFARETDGVKTVEGAGSLSCRLIVPQIPDGAQGLFFPVGNCSAYPHVEFPPGVQGIVAPWFNLNGLVGAALYEKMDVEADERMTKSVEGNFSIVCDSNVSRCTIDVEIEKEEETPWAALEGRSAAQLYDAMRFAEELDGVKTVSGKGTITCNLAPAPDFPEGAQGIFMPTASCVAYPRVQFPDGAVGIVAPWFTLNSIAGLHLYEAMPTDATDNTKSVTANFKISCDQSAQTCTIDLLEDAE